MNLIVAVDENWGIGNNNRLLVSIPSDLKRFKELTTGNVVILGRKTLATFPGGRPLPNRINIIFSKKKDYTCNGAIVVHSKKELMEVLKDYEDKEVFVIGGASIYKLLEDECDKAYVTKIEYSYEADTFINNLDNSEEWNLVDEGEENTFYDLIFKYLIYERR